MSTTTPIIAGVILAGGQSRRMGHDKATLPFHGSTLLEHTQQLLSRCGFNPVLVCGNRPDALRDRHAARGPLAGLDSALQYGLAHGIAGLLLVPVDMPLLDRDSVLALSQTGQTQQRVTHYHDHPLPLYCPVTTEAARLCEQLLQDNNPRQRALHVFSHAANALTLKADKAARKLDNINTPDDWQRLLATQQDLP